MKLGVPEMLFIVFYGEIVENWKVIELIKSYKLSFIIRTAHFRKWDALG